MRLSVEAHANARAVRVELADDGDTLRVWVRAKPVDGQANAAIAAAIATALALRTSQVHLISGARSRHKIFDIDLEDIHEVRRRLTPRP